MDVMYFCKTLPSNLPEADCSIFTLSVVGRLSRFVTINSTSIKPSIKVRNLTYHIFWESLWCRQPLGPIRVLHSLLCLVLFTFGENLIFAIISPAFVFRSDTNRVCVWKVVQGCRQGEVSYPSNLEKHLFASKEALKIKDYVKFKLGG